MSGKSGVRGYIVQSIVALFESLDPNNDWKAVTIEPDNVSEKVDITWEYDDHCKHVQVKSTQNIFRKRQAYGWTKEIREKAGNKAVCELYLVGNVAEALQKVLSKKMNQVSIKNVPLEIELLKNSISLKIESFYKKNQINGIDADVRDLITSNLEMYFLSSSMYGVRHTRQGFESKILEILKIIEAHVVNNPVRLLVDERYTTDSESQDNTGPNIFKLIGWHNLIGIKKKKYGNIEEERENTLDFYGTFESKLKDDISDNVFIEIMLEESYPDDIRRRVKAHIESIRFFKEENSAILNDKWTNNHGIIFILSKQENERNQRIDRDIAKYYSSSSLMERITYYIVDTNKLDFIVSSISAAREYMTSSPVRFLYPITEENSSTEKIAKRDTQLPPEYINSSILPIVMENSEKIALLIFCQDQFSKESLKKIIWLMLRLSSGFANEFIIYFPDYVDNESDVLEVLASYRNPLIERKVSVRKLQIARASLLNKINVQRNYGLDESTFEDKSVTKLKEITINPHLSEYLPYGDQLRPFLRGEAIEANDLRIFLASKGISMKTSNRNDIISLMTSLLFSPKEIEHLIGTVSVRNRPIDSEIEQYPIRDASALSDLLERAKKVTRALSDDGLNGEIQHNAIKIENIGEDQNKVRIIIPVQESDITQQAMVRSMLTTTEVIVHSNGHNIEVQKGGSSRISKLIGNRCVKDLTSNLHEDGIIDNTMKRVEYSSFKDNTERFNFLLSFMDTKESDLFYGGDITFVRYALDERLQIPSDYSDKLGKKLQMSSRGVNLSGLKELQSDEFKKYSLISEIGIKYNFEVSGIIGKYDVNLNFGNALKDLKNPEGIFHFQGRSFIISKYKSKIKDYAIFEKHLRDGLGNLVLMKQKLFELI